MKKKRTRYDEWRDQYFNGWLPPGEIIVPEFDTLSPMIAEACRRIDERKVEIARYVRSKYAGHLLEPDRK